MMRQRKFVVSWIFFFGVCAALLSFVANYFVEPREIVLTRDQAEQIGKRIWLNEGAGKSENLIVWNEGEDFPSLGIGHFIWYPEGVEQHFSESFPGLVDALRRHGKLPSWLESQKYPPWKSREEFLQNIDSEFSYRLRNLLASTMAEQAIYIVMRLENALPKILKEIKHPFAKRHVRENFYRVAAQTNGVYALVDYVNFKGEGIAQKERYNGLGWGLLQVLESMSDNEPNVMRSFVNAADFVLTRRVENAPRDERRWLKGWRKRLSTYLAE